MSLPGCILHFERMFNTTNHPAIQPLGAQWNHCLRTYCNKNFRGWIAGFNPPCQPIEIRTLGCPGILATGSYSPLTGIKIPTVDYYWYMKAGRKHARSKQIATATATRTPIRLARLNARAWASHRPGTLQAIWLQKLPLACLWFAVLPCFGPLIKKPFGRLNLFLPPSFAT